jgi:S1-C subfamily serine protease
MNNNFESKSIISVIIASIVTTVVVVTLIFSLAVHNKEKVAALLLGNSSTTGVQTVSAGDNAIVEAVKKSNPAVVSIIVTKDAPVYERYSSPFDFFLPQYRQNGTQEQEVGGGSGFLVSADGMIATNAHVVDDEDAEYTVYTNDGKKHAAKVIAIDESQDIAIIKISGTNFPFLTFGDSQNLQPGQTVIAIGNALSEYRNTVSVGVISGLSRSITAGDMTGNTEQLDEVIQTDAAINPGNSGGPLLDVNGNVIGMNVAVAISSQNIGFALPGHLIKNAVESVQAKGYISRPYIGVRYVPVTAALKEQEKLSVDYGMYVTGGSTAAQPAVIPGSPAAKAGIVEGDILIEFDGVKLSDENRLAGLVLHKKAGDKASIKLLRKGQERTVTLTLEEFNTR